jgi:hypothetical protein
MKMKPLHLRLTFDVKYIPDGTSTAELRQLLEAVMLDALNDGRVTGETPAQVDEYHLQIKEVKR